MNKVLIIGFGVVGNNLSEEIKKLNPRIYDKYKGIGEPIPSEFGFICVDTPLENGTLSVKEVESAISSNDCGIYVIKSTVPVGTVERLRQETGKRIVFSPEYYGGTQHCNNYSFDFTILGGEQEDCAEVQCLLQHVYDARHTFRTVDSKTAEMCKFMENSYLATKVLFCCEFYRACQEAGIQYNTLREIFTLDPRVEMAHTFVYPEHPWYSSHCLDKDVPHIANQFDMDLLKSVIEINDKNKQ